MCGIAGIVRLGEGAPPPRREEALAMAGQIRHRGPDGVSAWISPSGRCTLGHARLKVIDLETGDQPMGNEDGSIQVVFNGEIYNFAELRAELERSGHRFRTRSDTEVLVHGYEAWGEELPARLNGMFAFAVWDEPRGVLLLARDRAGQKPLFWTRAGERVAFASEIKALLALEWVEDAMDPTALPYYLAYGYVPGPATFYRGIRTLEPARLMWVGDSRMSEWAADRPPGGTSARFSGRTMTPRAYWRLHWTSDEEVGDAQACARVRSLLGDAVERRLVADVSLGAFLSGGIDSTLVVGLMRERIEGPIRTFSLGFADDPTYDETEFARVASRRFATEHTEFRVEAHEIGLVDDLVHAHDQPFGDSSAIPTYIVSRLTREHVTVALTGDGGDEMFAGYPRFLGMVLAESMPRWMVLLGGRMGRWAPHHANFRHPLRRFARFFEAAALPPEERMLRWIGFLPDALPRILRPELRDLVSRAALTESFRRPWAAHEGESTLARTLALNFETYLPEDLLVKADRCSMAHGLEVRAPFLDPELMTFAATLPDRTRIRGRTLKWLLRTAFSDLLPWEITRRGKMGFGVPLPVWFRTHWKSYFEARVLAPDARTAEWLVPEVVSALWEEHQTGRADHGHALWALLTLETWLRQRER